VSALEALLGPSTRRNMRSPWLPVVRRQVPTILSLRDRQQGSSP
jgi:hypothetical protein